MTTYTYADQHMPWILRFLLVVTFFGALGGLAFMFLFGPHESNEQALEEHGLLGKEYFVEQVGVITKEKKGKKDKRPPAKVVQVVFLGGTESVEIRPDLIVFTPTSSPYYPRSAVLHYTPEMRQWYGIEKAPLQRTIESWAEGPKEAFSGLALIYVEKVELRLPEEEIVRIQEELKATSQ